MSFNQLLPPTLKPRSYSATNSKNATPTSNTPLSPVITIENDSSSLPSSSSQAMNQQHQSNTTTTTTTTQQQQQPTSARTGHRRLPSSFLLPSTAAGVGGATSSSSLAISPLTGASASVSSSSSSLNNNNLLMSSGTPQSPSPNTTSMMMMYHFNTSSNSLLVGTPGSTTTRTRTPNSPPTNNSNNNNSTASLLIHQGNSSNVAGVAGQQQQQQQQQHHHFVPPLIPPVSFNALFNNNNNNNNSTEENNKMMNAGGSSSIIGPQQSGGMTTSSSSGNLLSNSAGNSSFQNPISHNVEYYHAHMAMFIKKKFEEEEEYLMYSYPNEISSPNIHIRSLKELRGTLHSVFGECNDILNEQVRFCYLTPTGKSVSSSWWNVHSNTTNTTNTNSGTNHNPLSSASSSHQHQHIHQGSIDSISSPNQSTPLPSSVNSATSALPNTDTINSTSSIHHHHQSIPSNISSSNNPTITTTIGVNDTISQKPSLLEFLQESKKIENATELSNVIQLRETIEKNKRPLIVTYKILKQYIFLLYLPIPTDYNYGNVMKSVYEQYVNELFEFLDFIYQDVEEIITNISDYQSQLDTIFNRFFEMVFHDRDFSFVNSFQDGFVKFQPSFHISQTIDAELSNLETIMKEDCFNIGTCLIYKGLLQLSHLPKNITKQVIRYLTHFNIIHRAQDSPEMVIIEKVFIKENSNPFDLLTINETSGDNGYDYLLSVITQGEKVMCSVLYAKRYPQSYYEGDLYYVDEMRTCLLQLEKKGIFSQLRGQFKTSHSLANVFSIPTVSVTANTESSRDSTSGLVGLGSFTSNSFYGFGLTNDHTSPTSSNTSSSSSSNSSNETIIGSNMKHFVTQGPYNVLLGYVVHSNSNGVILYHNSSNPAIASVFSLKCQVVRQVLQSKRSMSDDPIVEFGIHIDQKVPLPNNTIGHIGYWICGRMNDMLDEFYVCYEDSIPQDVVELSYRLYSRLYI
ncbi:predicted protein [Naegleria gruberi]|uniref:Predicted protein n=1 Tax=Naegleria gruberi TaxID=5762 RepID=D2V3E4_NAEGR|nr:uncharacterized protein NAEGRDRAFT_46377 [Naegleria gruberi]EFC48624.1 predicted protein [Naegleria gruberi]|eukprot:XP_002681368.1 predicted protein [Naegleria gruberi strain NEG-M]